MKRDPELDPPKKTAGDAAHALIRAGLSAIPVAGGTAVELFQALVTPPLERRRDTWMREVGEAIQRLESEKKIQLDELQKDEKFLDTLMQASGAALRTSQEEKRRALLNAIVNSAQPDAPDESLRQVFVNLVDTLTVWHLRILDLYQDPEAWARKVGRDLPDIGMGALASMIEGCFPDLRGRRAFYDQVWQDLYVRGLVNTEGIHTTMTGNGLRHKRTTEMGEQLLRFIRQAA